MSTSSGDIQIQGLRKRFPGTQRAAIDHVSLTIPEQSLFTLLGPSGCGKTTTLRCIAGLEDPDEGEITIGGETVFSSARRINVPPHRRRIGMVFQSYAIWPHMTVFQNVAYPLVNLKKKKQEIQESVTWALQLVGLEHLIHRPSPRLSGGEQQRVALARALVERPSVLLLDEPLSNLDAKLREQMRFELRELQLKLGLTAIYVTHDQDEAFSMSDLMAVMHFGRIVELGQPREVYQVPQTSTGAEFLGVATRVNGTVQRADANGILTIQSSIGVLQARSRDALAPGDNVWVYVRPEDVHVARSSGPEPSTHTNGTGSNGAGPSIEARLVRSSFLGGLLEWWAEVGDVTLRGRSLANTPEADQIEASAGGTVRLRIAMTRCLRASPDDPAAVSAGASGAEQPT